MMFAEIIHAKNAYLLLRIALITLAVEKNLEKSGLRCKFSGEYF